MKIFYEWICKNEMLVAKSSLGLLALLVFAAAVGRFLYHPMNRAMDVATFLFAWTVFLGADAAMRMDRLFSIEVIAEKLSPKAQLYLKVINYGIIIIFLLGMIVYGSWLSYTTRLRTFQGIPGFSYTWVTLRTPQQVEDNTGASGWQISSEDLQKVDEVLARHIKTAPGR